MNRCMAKAMISGVLCAAALQAAHAVPTTATEDGYFCITVPAEEVWPIDAATVSAMGSLPMKKLGEGTLQCGVAMDGYLADIHVAEGVLQVTDPKGLGTSQDALTSVSNGATLMVSANLPFANRGWNNTYQQRRIHLAGNGYQGQGALCNKAEPYFARFELTDDTLMTGTWHITFRQEGTFALNGHTLTIEMSANDKQVRMVGLYATTAGNIDLRKGGLVIEATSKAWPGTAENYLRVANGALLSLRSNVNATYAGVNAPWTLRLEDGAIVQDSSGSGMADDANGWKGPVELLGGQAVVQAAYNNEPAFGVPFDGVISGVGGFSVSGNAMLKLKNTANTFSGGVTMQGVEEGKRAWVRLSGNGALPADGGGLDSLAYGGLMLHNGNIYSLPGLAFAGEGVVTGACCGAWADIKAKSLTKTGDGTLDIELPLNVTGRTEVAGGTVRFASKTATVAAGLKWYHAPSGTTSGGTSVPAGARFSGVDLGVQAAYSQDVKYWETCSAPNGDNLWKQANFYTGYIRVPGEEGTDVTCNFISCMQRYCYVRVGDTVVLNQEDSTDKLDGRDLGNSRVDCRPPVTLKAGWQPIFISLGNSWGPTPGPNSYKVGDVGWVADFGLGVDWQGRSKVDSANYVKLVDPGDGSFLRYALPVRAGLNWYHAPSGTVTGGMSVPASAQSMGVDSGAQAAYSQNVKYWETCSAPNGDNLWKQANFYTGYIRVPGEEGADVTCNFISCMQRYCYVRVGDTVVLNQEDTTDKLDNRNLGNSRVDCRPPVTLKAGWQPIFISLGNSWGPIPGPNSYGVGDAGWVADFGLGVDWQGRSEVNSANYVKLVDPGSGSLLRYSLEEVTDIIDQANYRGAFSGPAAFAGGTVLDLCDTAPYTPFVIADLIGCPTVSNGALSVAKTWTVRASDLGKGPLTVSSGSSLSFADGVTLEFADLDPSPKRSRKYPILRVEDGATLSGFPTLVNFPQGDDWKFVISEDGRQCDLVCERGLILFVR